MPGYSPKYPLAYDETDGHYRMNRSILEAIKQNVKMLVLTVPGEKVMDPKYGVGLKRFLFQQSIGMKGKIQAEMSFQFRRYLPQINLLDIDIQEFDQTISISLYYAIPSIGVTDSLFLNNLER